MSQAVEHITPYSDERDKAAQVQEMFDSIAPAYDFMNRAMTFGIDKLWRRKAVKMIVADKPGKILDVATGTADLVITLSQKLPEAEITGVDLSEKMLSIGREKIAGRGRKEKITLIQADGTSLPFADNSFDSVTISYGIRNFASIPDGYREMFRVLKPGGTLTVVELARPVNKVALGLYNFYSRRLIPFMGRLVSKDKAAYSYLPESIAAVAQREEMTALIEDAGFREAKYHPMTFGTCIIYRALK